MNTNNQSILIIATRLIGDVLLTTPLIRSLRNAHPLAVIDILVFENTSAVLEGNPDLNRIIKVPNSPSTKEFFTILKKLFRKYDLTISVQGGDRPSLYSLFAGKQKRIGILHSEKRAEFWKRWIFDDWILLDNIYTHTVVQNLRLADCINVTRKYKVVPPKPDQSALNSFLADLPFNLENDKYIVLHPFPRFSYKGWHFSAWVEVIRYLKTTNFKVLLSGGPGTEEIEYCQSLAAVTGADQTFSIAGQTSLAILAGVLARASAYIGPDTAVTHLAAASNIKTIVLFGPSNPMKWGPWPSECNDESNSPWLNIQSRQESGNVVLLQGEGNCVPCYEEGCDRNIHSLSACLQSLPAERVINELERL